MRVVNRRFLFSAAVLLVVPAQLSRLAAQTSRSAQTLSAATNKNQTDPVAYIGRITSRNSMTMILVPVEANQVRLYTGHVGDISLSEVKISMLEKAGVFALKKPLSEGIFFETPGFEYGLRRQTDSRNPGSVMDGSVRDLAPARKRQSAIYLMNLFVYNGPMSDRM